MRATLADMYYRDERKEREVKPGEKPPDEEISRRMDIAREMNEKLKALRAQAQTSPDPAVE